MPQANELRASFLLKSQSAFGGTKFVIDVIL